MTGSGPDKGDLPWLIISGLWAVPHGALAATIAAAAVFDGHSPGPDELIHLVRVAGLHDGIGWYDSVIARGNAPYGDASVQPAPVAVEPEQIDGSRPYRVVR